MVSTPEEITDYSPSLPTTSTPVKKPSASKSLCLFPNMFDAKNKTSKRRVGAAKYKRISTKVGNILWNNKIKQKGHSEINKNIKCNLYKWITRHVQSPISNDCLKVIFDYQTETQLFPKLLLQVSVRELHNSLVSDPNDDGLKYARDKENNIIIRDSTLRSLLPPQLKQM